MNKNTLYITFDGLSDPLGQSQILPYLCGIAKNGYNITILSCEKKERLESEKANILQGIKDLNINWQYIIYDAEGGFISRMNYIRKIRMLAKKIVLEKNISLIHCRSYIASLIGLHFKLRDKIPFLFDMRGFWADERIDGGIWKKTNILQYLFYTYFKRKEKQFILQSDAIVSLTQAAVIELSKNRDYATIENKTTVIPCCTNTSLFDPQTTGSENLLAQLSKKDHVLIYTGSIGTWYYTREMIDCVLVWKKLIPELKLLILTKDQNELTQILSNYSPEESAMIIPASCSYKDVSKYLALANAAIFFIKPAYSKIASSPTKMAECWAMNLPIITNAGIGDNDLYFKEQKGGILLKEFTQKPYLESCKTYLEMIKKPHQYRELALNEFDHKKAIEKYTAIYTKYSK